MMKKIRKNLLVAVACATIVVGGTTVTALAEGIMRACPHENYTLEYSGKSYEDAGDHGHIEHYWEEIYCWDCGGYITRTDSHEEGHNYNDNADICIECGHRK